MLVIERAANDPRITVMVLDLKGLRGGGLNKLKAIGNALEKFKATGKKIYAFSDFYSQNQYFLASYADEIWLDPVGCHHLPHPVGCLARHLSDRCRSRWYRQAIWQCHRRG